MPYPKPLPPRYKLQVQEDENDPDTWHDVLAPDGTLLVFDDEKQARARLEALYPVLVKLEKFSSGPKRTRVLVIIRDQED
jgi:hypothetical protein